MRAGSGEPWPHPLALRLSVRGYQALLGLYPAGFRAEFGEEMLAVFAQRGREVHARAGALGAARWLLAAWADGLRSVWGEYGDSMAETVTGEDRGAALLGGVFLVGSWAALFALGTALAAGGAWAGALLVLLNALLAARALTRSTRYSPLAGMVALANCVLAAGLLAVQGAAARFGPGMGWAGLLLIVAQAGWLWGVRGDDFDLGAPARETGG